MTYACAKSASLCLLILMLWHAPLWADGGADWPLTAPDFDWTDREQVVEAIYDRLFDIVRSSDDPAIIDALARLCLTKKMAPEETAKGALEDIFRNSVGDNRLRAAAALAPLGDDEAIEALKEHVLAAEPLDLTAKVDSLHYLGVLQTQILQQALNSEDHRVVLNALGLVQRFGSGPQDAALAEPFLESQDEELRLAAHCVSYVLSNNTESFEYLSAVAKRGTPAARHKVAEAFAQAAEQAEPYLYSMRQQAVMLTLADQMLQENSPAGWAAAARIHAALGVVSRLPELARKAQMAPPIEQAEMLASLIVAARLFGTSKEHLPCGHVADIYAPDALEVILLAGEEAQKEGLGRIELEHLILALCRWQGERNVFALLGKDAGGIEREARALLKKSAAEKSFIEVPEQDIRNGMFLETKRFQKWRLAVYRNTKGGQRPNVCDFLTHLVAVERSEGGGPLSRAGISADAVSALCDQLAPDSPDGQTERRPENIAREDSPRASR